MLWDCAAIALGRRDRSHPLGGEWGSCACRTIPCVELEHWLPIVRWLCGADSAASAAAGTVQVGCRRESTSAIKRRELAA
jgi:hypothetical protein